MAKLKSLCAYAYSYGIGKWVEDAADPTKNKCATYAKYFDAGMTDFYSKDIGLLTTVIKRVNDERAAYKEQCLKEKGTWPSVSYCLYDNTIFYDYKAFVVRVNSLAQKAAGEKSIQEKEAGLTEQIKTLEKTAAEEKLAKQREKETAEAIKKATEQAEAATKLAQEEARKAAAEQEKAVAAAKAEAEKEAREAEKARAEADRLKQKANLLEEMANKEKSNQETAAKLRAEAEEAARKAITAQAKADTAQAEAEKAKQESIATQAKAEAERAKQDLELLKAKQAAAQPTVIAPVALPAPTYAETAPTVITPKIQCPKRFLYDTENEACVPPVAAEPAAKTTTKKTTTKKPAAPTAPDMTGQLSQDQMNKLLMQLLIQMMTQNAAK